MKPRLVIVVMSDQHSGHAVGYAGRYSWVQTPNLDAFAQQSIVFSNAYTPSPVCVPARFSALSGLYPTHSRCVNNTTPLPIDILTAAHYFKAGGYVTAFIGKMHPVDAQTHGFDYLVDFGHYYDYLGRKIEIFTRGMEADDSGKGCPWIDLYQDPDNAWNLVPAKASLATQLPDKDQFEAFVVREALRFLHTYREFPVFLFVSFLRPHTPLVVPPQYRDRYPLDKIRLPATAHENASCLNAYLRSRVVEGIETPEGQTLARQHLQRYGAAVSYVDDQFGVLMAGLRELGMDDQAAIVYTSDHGDMLFEHGMLGKFTFYEASAKVPFIFHLPGQTQGVVTNFVIDHTRLLPSLLDLAELPVPDLDGASLLPEISTAKSETKANPQGTAFSELSLAQDTTIRMIRKGVYKYCEYQQGYKQLFDLERDPDERVNLASQGMAVERELAQELHAHTRAMEVTRPNLAGPNPRF